MRIIGVFIAVLFCLQLHSQATIQRPTILNCTLDSTGQATFCVQNGKGGSLVVEYFLWGRWVKFDTVCTVIAGHDTCVSVTYQLHFGLNQLRFFIDDRISSTYDITSSSGKYTVNDSALTCGKMLPKVNAEDIVFKRTTYWELYNQSGAMVKRGSSSIISKAGLNKGIYTLWFETCNIDFEVP